MIMGFSLGLASLGRALECPGWVALDEWIQYLVDLAEQLIAQLYPGRGGVVLHLLGPGCTDDCTRDVLVLKGPGDSQPSHRESGFLGERNQLLHSLQDFVAHPSLDHVRTALLVGRPRASRRLLPGTVLPGEYTLGDGREDDLGHAERDTHRHHMALDAPPQHRILRLVGDHVDAELLSKIMAVLDLLCRPLT